MSFIFLTTPEKWETLYEYHQKRTALWATLVTPDDDGTGKHSLARFVGCLQRLSPLIAELQKRPEFHWLVPMIHHAELDLRLPNPLPPNPEPPPSACLIAFRSPTPETYQMGRYLFGEPNSIRYKILFSGSLLDTINAAETHIRPIHGSCRNSRPL